MSDSGWVREYRKITDWGWYKHMPTCHLFRHLIIRAQYKAGEYRGQALERGQLLTGRKQLAFETGLTEQQTKTALRNLQITGEITQRATNAFSVITICNYNHYQDSAGESSTNESANEQPATTPTNNQQSTSNQPAINHMQEEKKEKKKEKKKEEMRSGPSDEGLRLAGLLRESVLKWKADAKTPEDLTTWATDIDRMISIDDRKPERIEAVLKWLPTCSFWAPNVRSGSKLRIQYDVLEERMNPQQTKQQEAEKPEYIPSYISRPHPSLLKKENQQ